MKRPPGRPPLDDDDPSTSVTVKVPSKMYDYLYERSQRERVSVPEIIRRELPIPPEKRIPK